MHTQRVRYCYFQYTIVRKHDILKDYVFNIFLLKDGDHSFDKFFFLLFFFKFIPTHSPKLSGSFLFGWSH